MSSETRRLSDRWQVPLGLLIGTVIAAGSAFILAATGALLPDPALAAVALLGFRRTPSFQAASLIFPVLLIAFLTEIGPLQALLPGLAAFLGANLLVRTENAPADGLEHLAFVGVALVAGTAVLLALHGPTAALHRGVGVGVIAAFAAGVRVLWLVAGALRDGLQSDPGNFTLSMDRP